MSETYYKSDGVVIRDRGPLEVFINGQWKSYPGIIDDWQFNSDKITKEEADKITRQDVSASFAGHAGRPGERGGSLPAEEGESSAEPLTRSERAKLSHSPMTAEKHRQAMKFEKQVHAALPGSELVEAAGEFDESQHPRDETGKWTGGGGGGSGGTEGSTGLKRISVPAEVQGEPEVGKWITEHGTELSDHAKALGIPPAWTNVRVADSPDNDLQAIGTDAKGRVQRIYSDSFEARQAEAKFSRNAELIAKQEVVFAQTRRDMESSDPKVREAASAMSLIQETGIRPGSDTDTKSEVKAYGATTLEGRHVVESADGVRLQFTGKKGVALDIPVTDARTADMLRQRKQAAGDGGRLFDTSAADVLDYSHSLNGGGFKSKDFRTLKGTVTAIEEVAKIKDKPKTMKDYKKIVMGIAKIVSQKLGNTPSIALKAYINPFVFTSLKPI